MQKKRIYDGFQRQVLRPAICNATHSVRPAFHRPPTPAPHRPCRFKWERQGVPAPPAPRDGRYFAVAGRAARGRPSTGSAGGEVLPGPPPHPARGRSKPSGVAGPGQWAPLGEPGAEPTPPNSLPSREGWWWCIVSGSLGGFPSVLCPKLRGPVGLGGGNLLRWCF